MVRVTSLTTHPLKSCAGVHLEKARITPRGLGHDRDFMVVDDEGRFVSQRQIPELALVAPSIGERSMTLEASGMGSAEVPLEIERNDEMLVAATVHGKLVAGQRVGDALDEWFTTFLPPRKQNRRFRLLRIRDDLPRYVASRDQRDGASNQVGFADANSMLLASEPSLAQLNDEMDEPVPMTRFRPNIVVDGEELAPYDEDYWTLLRIGHMTAFVVKACGRCVVPDVDQETAVVGKQVRRALRSRRGADAHDDSDTGVFFAQNLNHVYEPGLTISVGDPVEVIARGAEANVILRG